MKLTDSEARIVTLYKHIPYAWVMEADIDNNSPSYRAIVDTISSKVVFATGGGKVFVSGSGDTLYKILLDAGANPLSISAVDFIDVFDSAFNKTEDTKKIPGDKFIILYNVGKESAVNTTYSSKLLDKTITQVTQNGYWVFIVSDYSYTEFTNKYKLEISNKLNLKRFEKKPVSI
jgi:hypothetical protein